MKRLLLVHALAPPQPGGTGVVLYRLLSALPGWHVDVVADRALRRPVRRAAPRTLPGRYHFVLKLPALPGMRPLLALADLPLAVIAGVRAAAAAKRARSQLVLTALDGGFSQIAAALAARLTGLPLVVIVFDLWEENAYGRVEREAARRLERRLLGHAAAVVVFCEAAANHYARKHGLSCQVIDTPIDVPRGEGKEEVDRREVLVAGAVYWAQEDAVRRLLRAASTLDGASVTVLGNERELRRRGIEADRFEPALPSERFRRRIARAGVLFLGLSHDSPHPAVVRTATPARLPEYMAAERPLLVHAPRDSHVATYARSEEFAEVVDEADETALARALWRLLDEPEHAAALARRARSLAAERHDAVVVRAALARILEQVGNTGEA